MGLLTFDEFMKDDRLRNSWVCERGWDALYVRKGPRLLGNRRVEAVVDLGSMTARRPGHGAFRKLVAKIRRDYPAYAIYVENVIPEKFREGLVRLGFTRLGEEHLVPSFYLLPVVDEQA